MSLSRRDVLGLAVAAPLGLAAGMAAATVGRAVGAAVTAVRPPASGTSATRCARCGDSSHTMLDATCPAAPRVIGHVG